MKTITLAAAATLGLNAAAASAQYQNNHHRPPYRPPHHGRPPYQSHWQVIGNKTVNGARDSDVITVPGRRMFRQIRLCGVNAPLRLRSFNVFFANGGHQRVATRELIAAGTCTRDISLQGGARDIASIHLSYERVRHGLILPKVQVSAR
jgi:endonuclease YncB( thermonuclease family)